MKRQLVPSEKKVRNHMYPFDSTHEWRTHHLKDGTVQQNKVVLSLHSGDPYVTQMELRPMGLTLQANIWLCTGMRTRGNGQVHFSRTSSSPIR